MFRVHLEEIILSTSLGVRKMGHGDRISHLPPRKWTTTTKNILKGKRNHNQGAGNSKRGKKVIDEESTVDEEACQKRAITLCESLAVSLCVLKDQGGEGCGVQKVQEILGILTDKMFDIKIVRSSLRCVEDCEKISTVVF